MSTFQGVPNAMSKPLKVLIWDIETAPGKAYFWRPKVRFIPHPMVITEPFIICWSAKWLGEKKVYSDFLTPAEVAEGDDSRVCQSIADMIREADIIVAHNGDAFDEPFLRGRLFVNDQEPLGPVDSIDTKKMATRDFDLPHNNLEAISKLRAIGEKIKTDFSWWTEILEGSETAMKQMVKYNRKDVVILEDVFQSMRPHVRRLRRMQDGIGVVCTNCGSSNVHKRGKKKYRTHANTFQQYQCQDCRRYFRLKTSDKTGAGDLRHL